MEALTALVLTRGLERLLLSFAGLAALWMGWKLFYRLQDRSDHQAEFTFKELTVRLQKVAPGILFALFGAVILVSSLLRPLNVSEVSSSDIKDNLNISYYGNIDRSQVDRWIYGLNTFIDIAGLPVDEDIPQVDRELLRESSMIAEEVRNSFLSIRFSDSDVAIWLRRRGDWAINPNLIPESEREIVERVEEAASQTLFDEVRGQ